MDYLNPQNYFRVKDLPEDQRPREKARKHGISILSDGELIALVLGTGTGRKNAVMLGNELIEKNNSLFELSRKKWKLLTKLNGIGNAKAIKLEAVFEISRRINSHRKDRKYKINGPDDVFTYFRHKLAHYEKEILMVAILNTRNEIITVEEVSRGIVNSTAAHPREIFNKAIENLGTGIILIHNHPSQDSAPSTADKNLTSRVFEAGKIIDIPLLDHVIITMDSYYSFKNEGLIPE